MNASARPLALALSGVALAAAYVALHPYRGVSGDALIYVTHEWAGRAGGALASDMLFANDAQTGLTLFTPFLRLLLSILPVGEAARLAASFSLLCWCAGAAWFCVAFARAAQLSARAAVAIGGLLVVAPLTYAASPSFAAGEYLAVPRPLAEALALACVAAALGGRWRLTLAFAAAAALFHPLVGATAFAIALLTRCADDRRALVVMSAACLAVVAALAFASPRFDAPWRALLETRAYYLFPTQAPGLFWSDLAWRGALVLLGLRAAPGAARAFLIALLWGCALALLVSLVAEQTNAIWLVRAQPWRMLWLLAMAAPACAALVALRGESRLAVVCIACAFAWREMAGISLVFSFAGCVLATRATVRSAAIEIALLLFAAAGWAIFVGAPAFELLEAWRHAPADFAFDAPLIWGLFPLAAPVAALLALSRTTSGLRAAPCALAAVCCVLLAWRLADARSAYDRALEDAPALAAAPDGEALWIDGGKETWFWLRRPNWAASIQGSSLVFSPKLAEIWGERARALVAAELEPPFLLDHRAANASVATPNARAAICARADAPKWIVSPMSEGEVAAPGDLILPSPAPFFKLSTVGERLTYVRRSSFIVTRC